MNTSTKTTSTIISVLRYRNALAAINWLYRVFGFEKQQGKDSLLAKAIGSDVKGKISLMAYVAAIPLAFVYEWLAMGIYFAVAILWLIPDRRIESILGN